MNFWKGLFFKKCYLMNYWKRDFEKDYLMSIYEKRFLLEILDEQISLKKKGIFFQTFLKKDFLRKWFLWLSIGKKKKFCFKGKTPWVFVSIFEGDSNFKPIGT